MTDEQKRAIREAWEALCSANNTVTGCAMFAPDGARKRDLPGLVEEMAEKERALQELFEDAGLWDEQDGFLSPTRESVAKLCAGLGLDRGDADRLWLAAGFVPPDLAADELRAALALVRTASAAEVAAATALIREARRIA